MEKFNSAILRAEITLDEGYRAKVYRCTAGKLTIGVGRNLDDVGIRPPETEKLGITKASVIRDGITSSQALVLLDSDISSCEADLDRKLPWWRKLDPVRQRVLVNMTFNMGIAGLLKFKNTLKLIETGQYSAAAAAMGQSLWARQVGGRATRLIKLMLLGPKSA